MFPIFQHHPFRFKEDLRCTELTTIRLLIAGAFGVIHTKRRVNKPRNTTQNGGAFPELGCGMATSYKNISTTSGVFEMVRQMKLESYDVKREMVSQYMQWYGRGIVDTAWIKMRCRELSLRIDHLSTEIIFVTDTTTNVQMKVSPYSL